MHVTSCIERASTVGRRVEAAGVERRSASEGVVLKADAAATRVATRATATLTCIGEISVKTFAKFGPLPKMKSTACCAVAAAGYGGAASRRPTSCRSRLYRVGVRTCTTRPARSEGTFCAGQ